jgi:hypothetical protein
MRLGWRAFTAHQILFCLMLQLFIVALSTDEGLCNGGTNLHEPLPAYETTVSVSHITLPNRNLGRCGRGRYRVRHILIKCRGPADLRH